MTSSKQITRTQLDKARDAAEKKFGTRSNVTAIDVGYKWEAGKQTSETVVRIHVSEKIDEAALEAVELFPKQIDGVPVDVIEATYETRRATQPVEHQSRFDTLLGGISIGHEYSTAGSLGAIVIDEVNERPSILSNWHVLAGAKSKPGDSIVQPGPYDSGRAPRDTVAFLERSMLDAEGDAAIAHLNGVRGWLPFLYGTFDFLKGTRDPKLGEVLVKSGRTTGQTAGRVDGEGTYFIRYEVSPGVHKRIGVSGFKLVSRQPDNPGDEEISSGGDSGSLWYHQSSGMAVGLHFAGETDPNPRQEHAIACNLTKVMSRLNVRLATAEDLLEVNSQMAQKATSVNFEERLTSASLPALGAGEISDNSLGSQGNRILSRFRGRQGADSEGLTGTITEDARDSIRIDVVLAVRNVLRNDGENLLNIKISSLFPGQRGKWLDISNDIRRILEKRYGGILFDDYFSLKFYEKKFYEYMDAVVKKIEDRT